jgi:hypothetical protein
MCSLRLLWRKNEGRGFVMLGIGSCDVEKDGKERGGAGREEGGGGGRLSAERGGEIRNAHTSALDTSYLMPGTHKCVYALKARNARTPARTPARTQAAQKKTPLD